MASLLDQFAKVRPISALAQVCLENLFGAAGIDQIFEDVADQQYTRSLLFSTATDLLVQVALFGQPSVSHAFQKYQAEIPVSITSVYNKLQNVEPAVCEALVSRPAAHAALLLQELGPLRPQPIAGFRLKIADGNVLGRSEQRLKELQVSNAAALPGMSVVLYDYASQLIPYLKVCEDAHTSECKLMPDLATHLQANDLLMADRNFCVLDFFVQVATRKASFLIRHHARLKLNYLGKRKKAGRCQTGTVHFQEVEVSDGHRYQAVIVERDKPMKAGGKTVVLLTDLPLTNQRARQLADLYLKRWTIEEAFRQLTQYLSCEVKTLCYPRAALLAFSLAVMAYNCLICVKGALASRFGWKRIDDELSMYYLAWEVKLASDGARALIPEAEWERIRSLTAGELAATLKRMAEYVEWEKYQKSPRGPKKPKVRPRRTNAHQATARILAARPSKNKKKTP
jgi:hypothetical protein